MTGPATAIRNWGAAWALRRQGPDADKVLLNRRRIYILPTRFGLLFALMLLVMLLAAMNYSNNLGFAMVFGLAGLALVAMYRCHGNLVRLEVHRMRTHPVFCGEEARFLIRLTNPADMPRYDIAAENGTAGTATHIAAGGDAVLELPVTTTRRGRLWLDRFLITTTWPFGLFRAWTWMHMRLGVTVYPRPAPRTRYRRTQSAAPPTADGELLVDAHDDFHGLGPYTPGASPRHIAWKAFARSEQLLIKRFTSRVSDTLWFTWNDLAGMATEERLSQLCRWILDAHGAGQPYGLRLPEVVIEPAAGRLHRDRCLAALAFHGDSDRLAAWDKP